MKAKARLNTMGKAVTIAMKPGEGEVLAAELGGKPGPMSKALHGLLLAALDGCEAGGLAEAEMASDESGLFTGLQVTKTIIEYEENPGEIKGAVE